MGPEGGTSPSNPLPWVSGVRRVASLTVTIHSYALELRPWLDDLVADFGREAAKTSTTLDFHVQKSGDGAYEVWCRSERLGRAHRAARVVGLIVNKLNQSVIRAEAPRRTVLHAGAVVLDSHVVVLPAPMESGKSTTVAGLCMAGFDYLTDEAAIVDPVDLAVHGYTKPITLDLGSHQALPLLRPPYVAATERAVQWFVPATRTSASRLDRAPGPPTLVFPRFRSGQETRLHALTAAEALYSAASCVFGLDADPRRHLDVLRRVVDAGPSYRLEIGQLEPAVGLLRELVLS